jgi:ribose/xylose/arabinose/galactoside ABC-type transport system permease subunit
MRFRLPGFGRDGQEVPLAVKAVIATVLLLVIGGFAAPSTVSASAILSMLPFFSILAIAAIGQHLVIQQRGLDLSVAGAISLSAALVTALPASDAGTMAMIGFVLVALAVGAAAGGVSGLIVTKVHVPPLVTTIGANSVLLGVTLFVSHSIPSKAPTSLSHFALAKFVGIPDTLIALVLLAAVVIFIIGRTILGRRFVAVGVNPMAAHAVAIPVDLYRIGTYLMAGLLYAGAGVLLAGYLSIPTVFCGTPYLLESVAAVVIGGNSIAGGGRGSVVATIVGAFFLTYLDQLVLAAGFETSMQDIVEFLIVISGVALPVVARRLRQA